MVSTVKITQTKEKKRTTLNNNWIQILGIIFIISAAFSYLISEYMIISEIKKNVVLVNNSVPFKYWKNPPAKVIRKYYFFNLNNPNEVINGKDPVFTELGPYAYNEKIEKKNIKFINQSSVQFNPVSTISFEPTLSVGNEDDLITFLNLPAMGMMEDSIRGNADKSTINFVNSMMETRLFVKRTVGQLIHGYEDDLLSMAQDMFPDKVKSNVFTMAKNSDGTIGHQFTIDTGYIDYKNKGRIQDFNGKTKLDIWYNDKANEIKGSDGTLFPPFISENDKLWIFNSELCRSLYFEYYKDTNLFDMNLKTFQLPKNIFYNSSLNPLNNGFCSESDCLGNGVQNISKCVDGLSVFASQPHFLNAEEKFLTDVVGLNPSEEKHQSYLNFDQITGVPISGTFRIQINYYLPNDKELKLLKNINPVLFPILWLEADVEANAPIREELKNVNNMMKFISILQLALIVIGASLITIKLFFTTCLQLKKKIKYSLISLRENV